MPVSAAPRTGITRWSAEGDPYNRTQQDADHALLDDLVAIDLHDAALAARPAVGIRGRYFTESVASAGLPGTTWREDGAAWRALGSRVLSTGTGDVAQVVAGVTAQTADLVQWRSGASTLGRVDNTGQLFAVGAQLGPSPQTALAAMLGVTPSTAAAIAAIIRGAVSQSADLLQAQTNAGTPVFQVGPGGAITSSQGAALTGSLSASAGIFTAATSASLPLNVLGASGQTSDLQTWRNSALTVLARVDSTGAGTFAGLTTAGTVTGRLARWSSAAVGDIPIQVTGFAGQTGNLQEWRSSTPTVVASIGPDGSVFSRGSVTGQWTLHGPATRYGATSSAIASVNTGAAGNEGVIVRGVASQSADLQQWQDSTAAVLAKVTATGGGQFSGAVVNLTTGSQLGSSTNLMQPGSASQSALVAKGLASQSGSLQQWQDSTGAVIGSMSAAGVLAVPVVSVANGPTTGASIFGQVPTGQGAGVAFLLMRDSGGADIFRVMPNGQVFSQVNATAAVASITKGASGQSGDLAQWQNSAGSVLAKVTSSGQMSPAGIDSFGTVIARTNGAGNVGLIAQGAVSQTANLQEWQNSSGTKGAFIDSAGLFHQVVFGASVGARFVSNSNNADLHFGNTGDGADYLSLGAAIGVQAQAATDALTPLFVQQHSATQSADLTRWTNANTSSVLARITNGGNVQGTGAYTTLSDASVKRNVRSLQLDPLATVRRLRPVHFDYVGGERDQLGFVANEVEPVLPHAVVPWDSLAPGVPDRMGRLGLRDGAILAVVVGAVQELDRRTASLAA